MRRRGFIGAEVPLPLDSFRSELVEQTTTTTIYHQNVYRGKHTNILQHVHNCHHQSSSFHHVKPEATASYFSRQKSSRTPAPRPTAASTHPIQRSSSFIRTQFMTALTHTRKNKYPARVNSSLSVHRHTTGRPPPFHTPRVKRTGRFGSNALNASSATGNSDTP